VMRGIDASIGEGSKTTKSMRQLSAPKADVLLMK
jgi:hypothetical protein